MTQDNAHRFAESDKSMDYLKTVVSGDPNSEETPGHFFLSTDPRDLVVFGYNEGRSVDKYFTNNLIAQTFKERTRANQLARQVELLKGDPIEAPLYSRISEQRRELKALNHWREWLKELIDLRKEVKLLRVEAKNFSTAHSAIEIAPHSAECRSLGSIHLDKSYRRPCNCWKSRYYRALKPSLGLRCHNEGVDFWDQKIFCQKFAGHTDNHQVGNWAWENKVEESS